MGTIIEFPADAASRRLASTMGAIKQATKGTIVILPVIRIERQVEASVEETNGGRGPEEGTAPRRRRRRR